MAIQRIRRRHPGGVPGSGRSQWNQFRLGNSLCRHGQKSCIVPWTRVLAAAWKGKR